MSIHQYGLEWPDGTDQLDIELFMIRNGGKFTSNGITCGAGLFHHYKAAMQLMWPEDDWHRWHDLAILAPAEHIITVLMGPSDCGKTHPAAKWVLTEYWADPDNTLGLVSSTDVRGLELRVWGRIKDLFNRARDRYPHLPGVVLESLHCITTDDIDDERARVLNKGIICIPCLQNGRYTGLGKYIGIKSKRLRQVSDECQAMGPSHLDALPNFLGKDYKGMFLGNPYETTDPLGIIAEPLQGWDKLGEPQKTATWKTRMHGGFCVNFVGTDSPNFDYPQDQPPRFPYMINRAKIEAVADFWGKDSQAYYSQCVGVMKTGLLNRRVITADLCQQHHAFDKAVWSGEGVRTRIYGLDAAYSGTGGDRCVGGFIEFGKSVDGVTIIRVNPYTVVPVSIRSQVSPEDQIALFVKEDCERNNIPIQNIFYDSTGRGTLGSAFARVFGSVTPVPVEFGGAPSKRPVRHDLFIFDQPNPNMRPVRRLKRCDEHYEDFVTELWFSARYVVECDQMRELPFDVMREGASREYAQPGKKIWVESKHDPKARARMTRSPDLFDWLVTCIEGARQRGFEIARLGKVLVERTDNFGWMKDAARKHQKWLASKQL